MMASRATETWDEVGVECTQCGVAMTYHLGSGNRVQYFRCGRCHRWVSSTYAEVFRSDAKIRPQPRKTGAEAAATFETMKARLERWLASIDEQDPYRTLGVSPRSSPAAIRDRYRELALKNHPDVGGSEETMRALNLAYERVSQS